MKRYLRAFAMCFSMFCAIPCPFHVWDEEARALTTLFLPFVGAIIGGLWTALGYAARLLALPPMVTGALLCAFPFLITGGIHFDGFSDVSDAVSSWRDTDERRKIMKDPHVGSFSVLSSVLLVMSQFALLSSAKENAELLSFVLIAVVSRSMAGLCVTILRPMSTSEYAGAYRRGVKKAHAAYFAALLVCVTAAGFLLLSKYGFVSLAVICGYALYLARAFRSLDGMSGDVSGYALTFGELCGIAAFSLI